MTDEYDYTIYSSEEPLIPLAEREAMIKQMAEHPDPEEDSNVPF